MDTNPKQIVMLMISAGFFLLILGTIFSHLTEPEFNLHIDQGVYGTVTLITGDCSSGGTCKEHLVSRAVYARDMQGQLVGSTKSNDEGFYEIKLPSGDYNILVDFEGKEYCKGIVTQDDQPECLVIVEEGLSRYDVIIDTRR